MNNPFNLPNNGMFNPNNPVILGGMAGLNIGAGIGAGVVPIIDYVEGNLKTDTKKMSRGNIRQVDKTIKAINVSQQDNAEEIFRALRKARSLREDITIRLRRGELTEEGLDNLNNKLALLNQHIPKDMEIPEVLGSFKKGGMVKKTGLYQLHKGEKVIPVKDVKKKK